MIRIDEIYNHTFWPYIKQHIPLTRMFYCDPPGRSDPESLLNNGSELDQLHYTFFHDQEPIHLDIHKRLFDAVSRRNNNLNFGKGSQHSAIVTSECNSEFVDQVCSLYGWEPYYYFYHGWAALDWYRGYDRSFLIPDPTQRTITKSFISPNRIIGGKRRHRVELMYLLLTRNITNAHISFPKVCPAEGTHIQVIAKPEQQNTFTNARLPWHFPGETDHPMHSCWLSLFDESAESLAYVVTETVYEGRRHHLTEKTFKPICLMMPFVLVSTAGSLHYLRSYGFKTFNTLWDESYDSEIDDTKRLIMIADLLKQLDSLSLQQKQNLYTAAIPIIQHNYNHFYNGAFESILWTELTGMLNSMAKNFHD
jgi:hypothetical protein